MEERDVCGGKMKSPSMDRPMQLIKVIFCFLFVFAFLYYLEWIGYPSFKAPFLQTADLCLTFLKENTLYGGQPYCVQGPITYITALFLSIIFPNLQTGMLAFYCIVLFVVFYCMYLIKVKETNNTSCFLFCFLTLFLLAKLLFDDFASLPAILFLVLGFYILFYTQSQWKEAVAGLFFGLALFSKTHAPLVIGPIILFYFITTYKTYRTKQTITDRQHIQNITSYVKSFRKEIILLFLPTLLLFFLLKILFPGFITYVYTLHSYNPTIQPILSVLKELVLFKYYYNGFVLLLYIGIVISLLRLIFYKKFDVFSFISSLSFFVLIVLVSSKFSLYKITDMYRYFLIFAPFYIMNLFKFGDEFQNVSSTYKKHSMVVLVLILLCLIFVVSIPLRGLTFNDFILNEGINEQKIVDRIKLDIEKPLLTLPKPQGKILSSQDYIHRYDLLFDSDKQKDTENLFSHFLFVSEDDFVNVYGNTTNQSSNPDMAFASNFIEIGVLNSLTPYTKEKAINTTYQSKQIEDGEYDIILSPVYPDQYYDFLNMNNALLSHYCVVELPFFIEGTNDTTDLFQDVLFQNWTTCQEFAQTTSLYYTSSFDSLCQRGRPFIDIIQRALQTEGITLQQKCTNNSKLFLLNNAPKFQSLFFCVLILIYLAHLVIMNLWRKKIYVVER